MQLPPEKGDAAFVTPTLPAGDQAHPVGLTAEVEALSSPVMTRVWRVSAAGQAGSFALPIGLGIFGGVAAGGFTGVIFPFLVGLLLWWLATIRPTLTLTEDAVIVRNPIRTIRVPLADITDARPGRRGVTICVSEDCRVAAWAVQKSNLARWTGRDTRADQAAEVIRAAAR